MSVSPVQYYEINGQVYPLLSKWVSQAVVGGAGTTALSAVSGYRHRIMGATFQSNATTTTGVILIYDGSTAGTILMTAGTPARDNSQGPFLLPITDTGYFETSTGNALVTDAAVQAQTYVIYYITYKPI